MAWSFVAGHYTATWSGSDIGTTRDGFRLREIHHAEMIVVDEGGDVPVDGVIRGTEALVQLDWVEYTKIKAALYAQAAQGNILASVGLLMSGKAATLVLSAASGTPAFLVVGAIKTLTATKAIIESDIEQILAARLNQGPATFRLLPDSGASNVAYTVTSAT